MYGYPYGDTGSEYDTLYDTHAIVLDADYTEVSSGEHFSSVDYEESENVHCTGCGEHILYGFMSESTHSVYCDECAAVVSDEDMYC